MIEKVKIMPKIVIDSLEYNTEDLSENGKAQLASLQFIELQLQRLRNEIVIYQMAKRSYITELKNEIEKSGIQPLAVDAPLKD